MGLANMHGFCMQKRNAVNTMRHPSAAAVVLLVVCGTGVGFLCIRYRQLDLHLVVLNLLVFSRIPVLVPQLDLATKKQKAKSKKKVSLLLAQPVAGRDQRQPFWSPIFFLPISRI
jgi:hypothetical protein